MIKALIVDDEPKARESLLAIFALVFPEVEVIAEAAGVEEAYLKIIELKPNTVFLDMKMGDGTGFDLLRRFKKIPFKVVFVTAFDQYAIEAIKFTAFDYLLKPINTLELKQTIERLSENLDEEEDLSAKISAFISNLETKETARKKIVLKTNNSIHLVNLGSIIRCEADTNYTHIYVENQPRIMISKPLKHFDEMLCEYGFLRVHQSHLINLNFVNRIDKVDGGVLVLNDNTIIPIAVRKREELFKILENL
ncbi:MAG TPA: DNA-binding response regulator [Bacteroidales bacterium]|nr:DNA-binding response regulator [Bacteroidales bacterium]